MNPAATFFDHRKIWRQHSPILYGIASSFWILSNISTRKTPSYTRRTAKSAACAERAARRRRRRNEHPKSPRPRHRPTTNPFLAFFVHLRARQPCQPVTKLARVAGRRWQAMSHEERQKYVDLADAERRRRLQKADDAECCRKKVSSGRKRRWDISALVYFHG